MHPLRQVEQHQLWKLHLCQVGRFLFVAVIQLTRFEISCYAELPVANDEDYAAIGDENDLGIKPSVLVKPLFASLAYDQGRLSCGMDRIDKRMDLRTYVEVDICILDVRFRDEIDADLEIGWTVSHKFEKISAFASTMANKVRKRPLLRFRAVVLDSSPVLR